MRKLILLSLSLFLVTMAQGQGVDVNQNFSKFSVLITASPSLNFIDSKNSDLNSFSFGNAIMIVPSINVEHLFTKSIGIKLGIGINTYRDNIKADSIIESYEGVDIDGDSYLLSIKAKNVSEKNSILTIDVPLQLLLNKELNSSFIVFVNPGVIVSMPVVSKYEGSANVTTQAFFSKYNLQLNNLPEYGLFNDKTINSNANLNIQSFFISGIIEAGMQYNIKRDLSFMFGVRYSQSFSSVLKDKSNLFTVNPLPNAESVKLDNLLPNDGVKNLKSLGLFFGIKYLITYDTGL